MRWKRDSTFNMRLSGLVLCTLMAISACDAGRRPQNAQRRRDTVRNPDLYSPAPSAESLQELAQAMGAAGFEHYTEGRALVKRLIPADSQPDLDVVEHQGVIGKAGVDFPAYPNIPNTGFNCKNVPTGYYADLETDCQVFHICDTSRKISFLCPNGTIFSQSHLICDWWFKVDCASAPALYESSAEYYSNEQKKSQKITHSLSKNSDLQFIDSNVRAESRRTSVNVPSTTERLLRHRQRLQSETPLPNAKATARSFQALFADTTFNPTQRTQATTAFEKRRRNLVQLIANNFGNPPARTTQPSYTEASTYRTPLLPAGDYNSLKEMQVAAETASFAANNNNRQFLQEYNSKNFRPYPVYTPNVTPRPIKPKSSPTLTTLYDIRDKQLNQATHQLNQATNQINQATNHVNQATNQVNQATNQVNQATNQVNQATNQVNQVTNQVNQAATNRVNQATHHINHEVTTKRSTLVPYSKSYVNTVLEKHEPYTRPGVSSLKEFLEKEKNKTATTTEKITQATDRSYQVENNENIETENKVVIETKNNFESATKIPQTTRSDNQFTEPASSERLEVFSTTSQETQDTTEPSYQERRERLMRKLNLDNYGPTEPTLPTLATEKFYGDQPNRPGLVVPPSLTPKTLHSLAIYYATALDNLSTNSPSDEAESTTLAIDDYDMIGELGLFSRHTINKYSNLFSHENTHSDLSLEDIKLDPNGTYNELADDLSVQQSQNPLATSPQIRELAQVFTHALSAYLQDPVQFRKVLSDIRPTHPSFGDMLTTTEEPSNTEPTTTVNEDDDEILGFSDDNKARPLFSSLRDPKSLNLATEYSIPEELTTTPRPTTPKPTTAKPTTTERDIQVLSSAYRASTTPRSPFRCCGRISASYTTASTPISSSTTPVPSTTIAKNINNLASNHSETYITTTENTYIPKYGGFQNNLLSKDKPYGNGLTAEPKPLSQYVEVTNLPTAWGVDASDSTLAPITNAHVNNFESKKIKATTAAPTTTAVYFTETDSSEQENEEELQRAHSQSFVGPQNNNVRHGKQVELEETLTTVKKPSEDLEAPTLPDIDSTTVQTTIQPSTTLKIQETEAPTTTSPIPSSIFTSPDSEKTTFQWPSTFSNWHSTVVDPITLNDGLSSTGPEQETQQTQTTWAPNTATTSPTEYTATSEQSVSSSITVELTTPSGRHEERSGRVLKEVTSTEPAQDITTITDTVVEKAKEIMGGMNATTTQKLMNVMKKTKSKTVKRLILLLIQTCDDDHNITAEASKKALLEALMAVSQKDMDEIAEQEGELLTTAADYDPVRSADHRRMDRVLEKQEVRPRQDRRGKSLNFDASAINSLSNPTTTEAVKTTTEAATEITTTFASLRTTQGSRRGAKKFSKTSPAEVKATKAPFIDAPIAEARVAAPQGSEPKTASDTRALELLRSLYTIAARWG